MSHRFPLLRPLPLLLLRLGALGGLSGTGGSWGALGRGWLGLSLGGLGAVAVGGEAGFWPALVASVGVGGGASGPAVGEESAVLLPWAGGCWPASAATAVQIPGIATAAAQCSCLVELAPNSRETVCVAANATTGTRLLVPCFVATNETGPWLLKQLEGWLLRAIGVVMGGASLPGRW